MVGRRRTCARPASAPSSRRSTSSPRTRSTASRPRPAAAVRPPVDADVGAGRPVRGPEGRRLRRDDPAGRRGGREIVCLVPRRGTSALASRPADEVLDPGDTLLEIDGAPLATSTISSPQLADKEPGDTVEIEIDRPEAGELTVTVELIASPDDPDADDRRLPPVRHGERRVAVRARHRHRRIGGPSAGLAFTLTLIDELSPGELTGGQNVAVTGTIELDGTVGAIGGLAQKVSAVRQVGVDISSCPPPRARRTSHGPARSPATTCEIIPVATLDEALAALERSAATRSTRARLIATNGRPGTSTLGRWPSRSRAPTRRRRRLWPMPRSAPPGGGSTSTRCASSCAWSPPSWPGCRSASASSSASCAAPQSIGVADGGPVIDDETVDRLLGEETSRILQTARESAPQIKIQGRGGRGTASCARPPRRPSGSREEAEIEATRRRTDAAADAEAEVAMAKQQGREMVEEARAYRERVLSELARRRELARQQIEQLIHGPRSPAAGVRAGPPRGRRRGRRADPARRARGVRRPVADHRPGADDGARRSPRRPLVDRRHPAATSPTASRRPTA